MASKVTVVTTGPFMLIDIFSGEHILAGAPTEVEMTPFIKAALDDGRLEKAGKAEAKAEAKSDGPTTGKAATK